MLKQTTLALCVASSTILLSACQLADDSTDTAINNTSLKVQSTAVKNVSTGTSMLMAGNVSTSLATTDTQQTLSIPVVEAGVEKGILSLSKAWVSLDEIEIEKEEVEGVSLTEEELEQQNEIEFDGPFFINLLTNESIPEIPSAELLPGIYEEIELEIEVADALNGLDREVPVPELADYSLVLEGHYTPTSSQPIAFKLTADIDEEIELQADSTQVLEINADTMNNLIIAFRLRQWFNFIDDGILSTASLTDGELILDTAINSSDPLLSQILENIKQSADFGEDDDDDGELSSDEDDDEVDELDD